MQVTEQLKDIKMPEKSQVNLISRELHFRKKRTYFDANSVHFLSHVHSGKSFMQLCFEKEFKEKSVYRLLFYDLVLLQMVTQSSVSSG